MIQINFTAEDINGLHYERFNHPHPRVMRKMEAIYLKSLKLKNDDICKITKITSNTLRAYMTEYIEGGIDRLKEVRFHIRTSALEEYSGTIEQYFKENPPVTIAEAAEKIEQLTGIRRGLTQVEKFVKSLGFKRRKIASIPVKALTEEKKTNKKNSLGMKWSQD